MLTRAFLLALFLAALEAVSAKSAGCGKSPLTSGTKTLTVNGKQRQYILDVPANYDPNRAYRLIFGFHWLGGTMQDVATGQTVNRDLWQYYGLKRLADNSAIFVAPQGLGNGWGNSGGEDITFVDQMITTIENGLCVDESQRFATGFSFGGGMSYAIACARAKQFRAVAAIAGAQISGCSGGNDPIAYLGIHGTRDNVLGIATGRSLRDRFLQNNGCASKNAPEPSNGSMAHIKTTYSCRAGYPVTWIAHDGDHDASPADNSPGGTPAAEKGRRTWAPAETWSFFTQFSSGPAPPPTSVPPPTSNPAPSNPPPSSPPSGSCSALYGQCGGNGYTGPKCCSSGTCRFSNEWYSQCL